MPPCERQADALQRLFKGQSDRPRFKRRSSDSVVIPGNVRIRDGRLWFPRLGWMTLRRRGGNPYPDGVPKSVAIKRVCGTWHAVVCYEVAVPARSDDGEVVGVDMNVRQVTASDREVFHAPDTRRLEARKKRYARRLARQRRGSRRRQRTRARLAGTQRRIAMARRNWQHHVSRRIARNAGTVVIEDLETRNMTASAKGTVQTPGTNVRQKAGLNREILGTGWGGLRQMLGYKALRVVAVNPAHTSQTCAACGSVDAANRPSQAIFSCVACGHADNAARNIRRRGLAHLHEEGRSHPATPMSREMDRSRAARTVKLSIQVPSSQMPVKEQVRSTQPGHGIP